MKISIFFNILLTIVCLLLCWGLVSSNHRVRYFIHSADYWKTEYFKDLRQLSKEEKQRKLEELNS